MVSIPGPQEWHHGKYDGLLPRYTDDENAWVNLPVVYHKTSSVLLAVRSPERRWWLCPFLASSTNNHLDPQYGDPMVVDAFAPWELEHARILTGTLDEATCFENGIALSSATSWPDELSLTERINALRAWHRMYHCDARVDFHQFSTPMQAWRWRNMRRIARDWGSERTSTHQWARSIDDRPWQEVRMAYDLRERQGAVLDIRAAYAAGVQHLLFPIPGQAWQSLKPGQRATHAMHAIAWTPTDTIGRFYHPWRYNLPGSSDMPAYRIGDTVHTWVLDDDIPWLLRHGHLLGFYQTIQPTVAPHPLAASIHAQRALLDGTSEQEYKVLLKKRLVSAHTWTWQPRPQFMVATTDNLVEYALREYTSRPAHNVGNLQLWSDPEVGDVVKGIDPNTSGYYTPVMWLRMHLRSHMLRRIEYALTQKLDIAYINVDGVHVCGENHAMQNTVDWIDPKHPWWQWRIDSTFERGIWMRPGVYALQHQGHWQTTQNWPADMTHGRWAEWVCHRGTLDVRSNVGYWRRADAQSLWLGPPSVTVGAERKLRHIIRTWIEQTHSQ